MQGNQDMASFPSYHFKGRHINEQVWNHLVPMLFDFGILQVADEQYYVDPDINVESNLDVPDLMDLHREDFDVDDSDSEDEELEFVDSFY